MIVRYKAVVSGDVIEIYEYEKPILSGKDAENRRRKSDDEDDSPEWIKGLSEGDSDDLSGKYRDDSLSRARKKIRRLINANVYKHPSEDGELYKPVFMTLTFAENVTDVDLANKAFKQFIRKLNGHVYGRGRVGLKYVTVIEFQKRGAVHYHCVFFNLPFIDSGVIASLWGQGFIKVNSMKKRDGTNCDNVGAYVTKYMQKELDDERLHGRKCYLVSKGLHQPEEIALDSFGLEKLRASIDSAKVYEAQFDTDYLGMIQYQQYNLTGLDLKPDFSGLEELAG
uniref:Rep protein n=1 Tax=Brevibacillus borstelensis TaxID=45462 RepID=Q52178_9BACL|nr:rep protein [Brevibacillus borstelensis]